MAEPPVPAPHPPDPGAAAGAPAAESASLPFVPASLSPSTALVPPSAEPESGGDAGLLAPVDVSRPSEIMPLAAPPEPTDVEEVPPVAGALLDEPPRPGSGGNGLSPHAADTAATVAHARTRQSDLIMPGLEDSTIPGQTTQPPEACLDQGSGDGRPGRSARRAAPSLLLAPTTGRRARSRS
jgi:hypothetical protein